MISQVFVLQRVDAGQFQQILLENFLNHQLKLLHPSRIHHEKLRVCSFSIFKEKNYLFLGSKFIKEDGDEESEETEIDSGISDCESTQEAPNKEVLFFI